MGGSPGDHANPSEVGSSLLGVLIPIESDRGPREDWRELVGEATSYSEKSGDSQELRT